MYQIRTHFPLCSSKAYYETRKELLGHIDKILKKTNSYRAKLEPSQRAMYGFPEAVTNQEMELCIHVVRINKDLIPCPVEELLGVPLVIEDPDFDFDKPKKEATSSACQGLEEGA